MNNFIDNANIIASHKGFNILVLAQLKTNPNVVHHRVFWSKLMRTRNVSLSGRRCWLCGSWKPLHFKLPLQKNVRLSIERYMLCDSWAKSWVFERVQVHGCHFISHYNFAIHLHAPVFTAVPLRVAAWAKLHRDRRGPVWNKSEPSAHAGKWKEMAPIVQLLSSSPALSWMATSNGWMRLKRELI